MSRVFAVDVGGTRIKAAIVAGADVSDVVVRPVDGGRSPFDQVADVVTSLGPLPTGAVLGVCIPGLVDAAGRSRSLPGKLQGLEGLDVSARLSDRFGVATTVVNDAVAAGIGEAVHGAGAPAQRVLVMTIGTGVGVCVIDRRLPPSAWLGGTAGLGGFIPVSDRDAGPADSMGRPDTIEALCCAARILDCARSSGLVADDVEGVLAAAARGDEAAQSGLESYRRLLVKSLVALTHAHMPELLVIGGGPLAASDVILDGVEAAVNRQLFPGLVVSIRPAALGDRAALIGLSVLAGDR